MVHLNHLLDSRCTLILRVCLHVLIFKDWTFDCSYLVLIIYCIYFYRTRFAIFSCPCSFGSATSAFSCRVICSSVSVTRSCCICLFWTPTFQISPNYTRGTESSRVFTCTTSTRRLCFASKCGGIRAYFAKYLIFWEYILLSKCYFFSTHPRLIHPNFTTWLFEVHILAFIQEFQFNHPR